MKGLLALCIAGGLYWQESNGDDEGWKRLAGTGITREKGIAKQLTIGCDAEGAAQHATKQCSNRSRAPRTAPHTRPSPSRQMASRR